MRVLINCLKSFTFFWKNYPIIVFPIKAVHLYTIIISGMHSKTCPTAKKERFAKIVNGWKSITIFAKGSVWQSSEHFTDSIFSLVISKNNVNFFKFPFRKEIPIDWLWLPWHESNKYWNIFNYVVNPSAEHLDFLQPFLPRFP